MRKILLFVFLLPTLLFAQSQYGCTDPAAYNYNANTIINDGSCCYSSFIPTQVGNKIDGEAANNS